MGPEGSLPYSQGPPLVPPLSQMHPVRTFPHYSPGDWLMNHLMTPCHMYWLSGTK